MTDQPAAFEEVLRTHLLTRRKPRSTDAVTEHEALVQLTRLLGHDPEAVPAALAEAVVRLCDAGSAAVGSIRTGPDGATPTCCWEAVAGRLAAHGREPMRRDAGPCSELLDANPVLLLAHPHRHFRWLADADPVVQEALLVSSKTMAGSAPVYGFVCAISHTTGKRFTTEDERILRSLAHLAVAAYRSIALAEAAGHRHAQQSQPVRGFEEPQRLLERVTASTEILIAAIDPEFTVTLTNPGTQRAFEQVYGVRVEPGTNLLAVLDHLPDERATLASMWRGALEGASVQLCAELGDPGRERRFYDVRFDPLRDETGHVVGAGVVGRDVTDRVHAEDALRRSEARLQLALDASDLAIWEWDIASDTITWSESLTRITGIRPDEVGRSIDLRRRLVHPDDQRLVDEAQAAVRSGRRLRVEYRIVRSGGDVRWVASHGHVELGRDGRARRMVGTLADITDRKRRERNAALMADINAAIAQLTSPTAIVQAVGERIARHVGEARVIFAERAQEGGVRVFVHPEPSGLPGASRVRFERLADYVTEVDLRALRDGRVVAVGDVEIDPDRAAMRGRYRQMGVRALLHAPYVTGGRLCSVLTLQCGRAHPWGPDELELVEDLAARIWIALERVRAIDALRYSERELRELSQTLEQRVLERTRALEDQTNRLRQLATELGSAEQRERRRLASVLHDDLQQLLAAARMQLVRAAQQPSGERLDRALRLLDDAVAVSRDLTRELRPPVLYEAGLTAALEWLAEEIAERHGFHVNVRADMDETGVEDDVKALVFECVRELVFNAVKYADVAEADLDVWQRADHLMVVVQDRGRGFEPQAIASRSGSGFGLFSIRERLAALGGGMAIHAAPGQGTRVELNVPLVTSVKDPRGRPDA